MPVQVGWPGTGVIAVNQNAVSSHPAVAQCAVIGVPDPEWGERVHAVVLRPDAALTAEDLREHVKALIAGYKAPRSLEITDAPRVPRRQDPQARTPRQAP